MMRRLGVAVLLAWLVLAAPAAASVDVIVAGLEDDRVHVVRGAEIDEQAVAAALDDDPGVAVVFTGAAPATGEQGLADAVVDDLDDPVHTVLVRSREGVAAASTRYSDSQLDGAIDRAFDELRESPVIGAEAFASALPFTGAGSDGDDDGGSGGGLPIRWVVIAMVLVGGFVIQLERRRSSGGGSWGDGATWGDGTSRRRSWSSGSGFGFSAFRSSRSSGFRSSGARSSGGSRRISGRSARKF